MDQEKLVDSLQQIKVLVEEAIRATTKQSRLVKGKKLEPSDNQVSQEIDFSKPLRPFVKTYSRGLSGPKKFTLLLARLAGGDLKKEISLSEMEAHWARMTSILGMKFNRFFAAQAKDNDWVESRKKGQYNLRPSWLHALKSKK